MAGEMFESEVTVENWPLHFAIAEALGGKVRPFDQYQGPYIVLGPDLTVGEAPYAVPLNVKGTTRLWLMSDGDGSDLRVYNETSEALSEPFPITSDDQLNALFAVAAAESVIGGKP